MKFFILKNAKNFGKWFFCGLKISKKYEKGYHDKLNTSDRVFLLAIYCLEVL